MKTAMPGYYRKNAACGVVHKAQASPADRRDAVVQVVYWCLVIAMHETLGMGKERLEKFQLSPPEGRQMFRLPVYAEPVSTSYQ